MPDDLSQVLTGVLLLAAVIAVAPFLLVVALIWTFLVFRWVWRRLT